MALLTPRERVVLVHLMDGLTAEQICQTEYVGLATVRTQIQSILMKLGVKNQGAAVAAAYARVWPEDVCRDTAIQERLLESA